MDRILIILEKKGPRASSAHILGLFSIIFKHVYWYIQQISGERLQDHWSSGWVLCSELRSSLFEPLYYWVVSWSMTHLLAIVLVITLIVMVLSQCDGKQLSRICCTPFVI